MVFTGTYPRSLDGKARFLLPKRLRDEIADLTTLFLTPGTDRCLEIHTQDSLNDLATQASRSAAGSRNIKSFSRLFYAQAEPCDIDGQGRIRIPQTLVDYAVLNKEIVIVGVGFNWEIWNVDQWQLYLETNEDEFDRISQTMFDQVEYSGRNAPGTSESSSKHPEFVRPQPKFFEEQKIVPK
jgi:MraZ protein